MFLELIKFQSSPGACKFSWNYVAPQSDRVFIGELGSSDAIEPAGSLVVWYRGSKTDDGWQLYHQYYRYRGGKNWTGYGPYLVSKSGLDTLTKLMAKEFAPVSGSMQLLQVYPSPPGFEQERWDQLVQKLPAGRSGSEMM